MSRLIPRLFVALFAAIIAITSIPSGGANAAEIEKRGEAFVVYLPGDLDYFEVFHRLQSEILAANWEITNIQNIDTGMAQYGLKIKK